MRMRILLLGALLSVLATASLASTITNGTFSIAGTIFVTGTGGVVIPGVGSCAAGVRCIFWQDTGSPAVNDRVDISPLGLPNGDITSPTFAGNDNGIISNLTDPPETPPGPFPAVPFLSFVPGTLVTTVLEINTFPLGVNSPAQCGLPPAAGQVCTLPGSPFNLENLTASSSTATFRMGGITNDSSSTWTGIFASQFNNIPYQTVLAQLGAAGFVSNTFSGQITLVAPIPEPGTISFLLLGTGMIAGATLLRRLSRR